jgi:hypothetical protein
MVLAFAEKLEHELLYLQHYHSIPVKVKFMITNGSQRLNLPEGFLLTQDLSCLL